MGVKPCAVFSDSLIRFLRRTPLKSYFVRKESSMAKKEKTNETPVVNEDLTQMHRDARRKKKRRKLIVTISICVAAIVVIVALVLILQSKVSSTYASSEDAVESAEVTTGSISETITGSGTLTSSDVESIDIPSDVEITDFYVEVGDSVSEGDLLASVSTSTLQSAMSDLQDQLDAVDEEIESLSAESVSSTITAGTSGRVKKIYAEADTEVADTMYEYGALILISIDGYMAVEIETDDLETGDSVTVTDSDGTEYDGTVEEAADGTAVILITDNGPEYEDEVTVTDSDGNEIGTGTLYIHQEMAVTGYAGTVSSISVSENDSVSSGATLITLTDTELSVNYDSLLSERETIEESLETLIRIYKEGGICATCDGVIESVYDSSSSTSSGSSVTAVTIASNTSMTITVSVDESDILYISEGLEAQVTISSISDDAVSGTVTDIDTEASSSSGVTTYSATVTIDKTEDMLSGMSASVVIVIQGVEDALLIPVDALYQTSSTSYVYTEYDESTGELSGMVEVTTGLSNGSYVEITDGLEEGDTVYYAASSSDSSSDFDLSGFGDVTGGDSTIGGDSSFGGDTSGGSLPGGDTSGGGVSGMPGAN